MARTDHEPRGAGGLLMRDGEVDVWVVALDRLSQRLGDLRRHLSDDERRRAGHFADDVRKRRYVARQGALREVLSRYSEQRPAALRLERSARGRPQLVQRRSHRRSNGSERIEFSVSDSHDLALVAVARGRALGVDVELVRPGRRMERVANRLLGSMERQRTAAVTPEQRLEAFYRSWTAAEAHAKARGRGLPALLGRRGVLQGAGTRGGWSVLSLDPRRGYVGSLVMEGAAPAVRVKDWPGSLADDG